MKALSILAALVAAALMSTGCSAPSGCLGNAVACGGRCVDLTSDTPNCGACGKACASGATCSSGTCSEPSSAGLVVRVCPSGEVTCPTVCAFATGNFTDCPLTSPSGS